MLAISKKWIKIIEKSLLVVGLVLLSIGLLLTLIFNVFLSPSVISHFTLKTAPEFTFFGQEFEFDCMIYEPKPEYNVYGNNRPVIVMVHGFMSSKIYFKGLAFELNKRGFVCLSITAPGHSASGGALAPTWENATLSAVKYLRDYNSTLRIDPNRIGLVGHSMGAFSVSVASILDQELGNYWINATVALGGPFLNITNGFGTGFEVFLNIPYIYPNIYYNPEIAMENVIIEGRTNITRPYNYMNIIGANDQAFSVSSAYELVYGMSSPTFWSKQGVSDQNQIISGNTYGSFNGTARRLVVIPDIGHIIEGQVKITCVEVIDWFEESMKLKSESNYPGTLNQNTILEEYRASSIPCFVIGAIILILPLTIYFGNWLKEKEIKPPKNAIELESKKMWLMFLIYGGIFVGFSFLATPIIHGLGLINLIPTDFLGSNIISLPLLVQGLLMLIPIIILILLEKKHFGMNLNDFGINFNYKSNLKNALYATLLISTLYVLLNLALSWTIHNLIVWRVISFVELFVQIFIAMIIFEIMFRGMIQNKLSRYRKSTLIFIPAWKELFISSIISGVIEGLGIGIIVTGVLMVGGMPFDLSSIMPSNMGISFQYLPPLQILIPLIFIILEIIFNLIKSWIFRKSNNNILASALFMALILAWILSVILPAISIYAPRLVFLT
ncbi:MAG: alpha/beta hydrolase family protein [Candidatus Helarchaeota archaeon]